MAQKIPNPEEKLSYYRKSADRAEKSARRATDPAVREAYFAIMRTWIYLADELEREMALAGQEGLAIDEADHLFAQSSEPGTAHKSR